MFERVLKTISRYNMLPPGARLAVAVSGGADSVCLLHVLREVGPRLEVTLAGVAHFNHKLRGETSDEDERFVAAMAADLGLAFYRAESQVSAARDNLEQAGRLARRSFFSGLIRSGACDWIALGHTRDDQAETVLFRLLRGSGLDGLAGIYPVTPEAFIRPLIDTTHAEAEEFLRARGIPWREDGTNRESRFARNRIRHDLLPQLAREWNPQITDALVHLADLAREEQRWWAGELDRLAPDLLRRAYGGIEMGAAALAALPRAAARRLVRRAILLAKGDLRRMEYWHVERIVELAHRLTGNGALRLPGLNVMRSFDWIRLARPAPLRPIDPLQVAIPGTYAAPDGDTAIRIEIAEGECNPACANLKLEVLRGRSVVGLELRGWRSGDHYRPAGRPREQKVQQMFQRARIPSWRRRFWPILTNGSEILWARRFGAAQEFAASEDTVPVLRIVEADRDAG